MSPRVLVLTGSGDVTADLLFGHLGDRAFRFNFDIFSQYTVSLSPTSWSISNPSGLTITSEAATSCLWWKAFNFYIQDAEDYISEEVKYVFREIYNWFQDNGVVKGNSPDFHRSQGKMRLLDKAQHHFKIPPTLCGWGPDFKATNLPSGNVVAKSLTSGLTTTNKVLFTQTIDENRIDKRYPWYLQGKVDALSDVTTFICGKKTFTFCRDRSNLVGLDWRNQQDFFDTDSSWRLFPTTPAQNTAIVNFCDDIHVEWGRIDFLYDGADLVFLEFNANGQFLFLDQQDEHKILETVVAYLLEDAGPNKKST